MSQLKKTRAKLPEMGNAGDALKHACELLAMIVDRLDGRPQQSSLEIDSPTICKVPIKQIINIYNEMAQYLPKVRAANSLESNIRARWKEHKPLQDLEKWRQIFIYCDSNNWLSSVDDKNTWIASLRWIVQRKNMEKIINQEYDKHGFRKGYRPQTPAK